MLRILAVPAALAVGLAVGLLRPDLSTRARSALAEAGFSLSGKADHDHDHAPGEKAPAPGAGHDHAHGAEDAHGRDAHRDEEAHGRSPHSETASPEEGAVALSEAQIANAGIAVAPVGPGLILRRLSVPGVVTPAGERVARVAAKVVGTVAELRKRLGDPVARGEVVAVLDSREVADARNDTIAALVGLDLQETLFSRDHDLWDRKVSAEQQFLRSRSAFVEAQLKLDLARQKLAALGVPDDEVDQLAAKPPETRLAAGEDGHLSGLRRAPRSGMQRYELRAPIAGIVTERRVDLGAPVNDEGQEKEIYTIADLSRVWVELAVPMADLDAIHRGQGVTLSRDGAPPTRGEIVFVSPMLDPLTRAGKVVAEIDNAGLAWRPGAAAAVRVTLAEEPVPVRLPRSALQTIEGESVAFVRTPTGFARRALRLGRGDEEAVEVVSGLVAGEEVAVAGSFVVRAELGKAEAGHDH